jgi:hypothetical protein
MQFHARPQIVTKELTGPSFYKCKYFLVEALEFLPTLVLSLTSHVCPDTGGSGLSGVSHDTSCGFVLLL